jgi:hypothetical protein
MPSKPQTQPKSALVQPRPHAAEDVFERVRRVRRREQRLDDTLDQSFPASDSPGWTLGPNRRGTKAGT